MTITNMKTCCTCKKCVSLQYFCKNKSRFDGINNCCSNCQKSHNKRYRKTYKGKKAQYLAVRRYLQTPGGLFVAYRNSAKQRNLLFTLTKDYFQAVYNTTYCGYCSDFIETVALDRVDNEKGYILENIIPCCSICNFMKQNLTKNEFIRHIKKIVKNF